MSALAEQMVFATEADFFAIPEEDRFHELLAGDLVQRALPSGRHGSAQFSLGNALGRYGRGPGRPDEPGGWRFAVEAEVRLAPDTLVRPDVAGWRRERLPRFPDSAPVEIRPDWVCEVLSPSNATRDLIDKMLIYHQADIPHYWVLDPERRRLRVHRLAPAGYSIVLDAGRDAVVRAEPFELLEIAIADLFDSADD